ncbi:MAG: GTP-binding protein, partial [Deltaproteobacteria bacterium]|nr:GTP-binding protein [Deltaproteobacteria bacterium]
MKKGEGEKLRNIGLFSHGGDGKTSLAEAILFDTGVNNRLGKVDEGSSIMDYEPEEINRHITISTSIAQINWEKIRINIVDTPGDANFIPDAFAAMRVVDGAIILVSAVSGVKVQTEKVWNYTEKFQIPRIIFVNKMDRERANFFNTIDDIKESLSSSNPVALQIPIGAEESFEGIIDLIKMKALRYKKDESGQFNEEDIPADLMDESTSFREKMIETLVESDDTIMEKYLDGEDLKEEELFSCLKKGLMNKLFTPVILGSALKNIGIQPLLNLI